VGGILRGLDFYKIYSPVRKTEVHSNKIMGREEIDDRFGESTIDLVESVEWSERV